MYLRIASTIAGCLVLTGCAAFEPEAKTRAPGQALKSDTSPARTAAAEKPKAASGYRDVRKPSAMPAAADSEPGSCHTIDQCGLMLRQLIDDPGRAWITKRPSATVYANGTRAFAYLALRTKLTCSEIALALDDLEAADRSLDATIAGPTRVQAERTRALNASVSEKLRAEQADRCGRGDTHPTG